MSVKHQEREGARARGEVKRGNGMTRNLHFDAVELRATRERGKIRGRGEEEEQGSRVACCRLADALIGVG